MTVDQIIDGVLEREGGTYTNDPNDSGGPTKWGITLAALSAFRRRTVTASDVRALTRSDARVIYLWRYVQAPGFGPLIGLVPSIAEELIDTGVNTGPARAVEMLQRALNALNRQGRDYPDVKVDGDFGARSLDALKRYLAFRSGPEGVAVMLTALNALQGEFYISLAERRPKDEEFLFGWLRNRVTI